MTHPQAIQPLLDLATILRRHEFQISPDQTISFIEGVDVLGPRDIMDIRSVAKAVFGITPDRELEFDALFRALFFGQTIAAEAQGSDEDDVDAFEPTGQDQEVEVADETSEIGQEATTAERLGDRAFSTTGDLAALAEFKRQARSQLPRRKSYRRISAKRGDKIDMRATLRLAAKRDGEMFDLKQSRKKTRQRRILLLIDVSGSMKDRTTSTLRFAHALTQVAERVEVFTLGTRLTRVTSALGVADADRALSRVSRLVADFDGGTRIGEALQSFLAVPRFAGFARGSAVVVLSDGLERGSPEAMQVASRKLSRLAWRLSWLTPLAADPEFKPQTDALQSILPYLDELADGGSVSSIASHVLNMAKAA